MTKAKQLLIFTSCLMVASCATGPGEFNEVKSFDSEFYSVELLKTGCKISGAYIKSKGAAIPGHTYHQLTVGAKNVSVAQYTVNCPPVFAGGTAQCYVYGEPLTSDIALAGGIGCPGYNQYNFQKLN